ncbi:MAG: aminoacyl-tRNA hydrolase [Deltaproteobacteria bacterium]|nr:aminoacyl-tRNA hydrolase [Deltaproteobacteria bacterium]
MKCVVGLGNPGRKYARTRHNAGFLVVDALAELFHIPVERVGFESLYGEGMADGERLLFCKPQTFMNASGDAVGGVLRYYRIDPAHLFVIHDDLDLEAGQLKFAHHRGSAGHRGIDSITQTLGTSAFDRLRIGIGRPVAPADPAEYVLAAWPADERESIVARAADAAREYLQSGLTTAMNRHH